mgnify:CR=1 FL=1
MTKRLRRVKELMNWRREKNFRKFRRRKEEEEKEEKEKVIIIY